MGCLRSPHRVWPTLIGGGYANLHRRYANFIGAGVYANFYSEAVVHLDELLIAVGGQSVVAVVGRVFPGVFRVTPTRTVLWVLD